MSNQCRCRLAIFSPHRKEKCTLFGKKGLLISPDASDALYNKPQKATPVQPEENSKPNGDKPVESAAPAAEDKKVPPAGTPVNQDAPHTTGNRTDPPRHSSDSSFSEHSTGVTKDPLGSEGQAPPYTTKAGADNNTDGPESSEAAKERLERLVAEALQGANLPPGTSINVTINVNSPVPPAADPASAGSEPDQEADDNDYKYISTGPVEAEPILAEAYVSELEETNDILANISIGERSPIYQGFSVEDNVGLLAGLAHVRTCSDDEDALDRKLRSFSPSSSLPPPVPPAILSAIAAPSAVSPVPVSLEDAMMLPRMPASLPVPSVHPLENLSPPMVAPVQAAPSMEDMMAWLIQGDEPDLNPNNDDSEYEEEECVGDRIQSDEEIEYDKV